MKELLELVKKFEGFSPTIYLCPAGYPTIGYGHIVLPNEKFTLLTEDEAEKLLEEDLLKYLKAVVKLSPPLPQLCIYALTSFTYNVGIAAYKASTLRRKLLKGDLESAAEEFDRWVFAGGRKLKGLIKRRQAEKNMYLSGLSEILPEIRPQLLT